VKQLMLFEGFEPPEPRKPYALFSPCSMHGEECTLAACRERHYRYRLYWPTGIDNERTAVGCFANPSTATAEETDPTVARWIDYCRRWGYGWAGVVNVRAWRATEPKDVPPDPDGIGDDNEKHIAEAVAAAEIVVCGWGKLGGDLGPRTLRLLRDLGYVPMALARNKDGSPGHPLYLKASLKPFPIFEPGDVVGTPQIEATVQSVSGREVALRIGGNVRSFDAGDPLLRLVKRGDI
jgi:hypothetical protein